MISYCSFAACLCFQVNEIYRDLANMVDQQQEAVEQIESNTEGAHARAQEGLVQVCYQHCLLE